MTFKQQIMPKVSSARKAKYSEILPMSERGYVQETGMNIAKGNHWVIEACINVDVCGRKRTLREKLSLQSR
jgi:hypothetical protein